MCVCVRVHVCACVRACVCVRARARACVSGVGGGGDLCLFVNFCMKTRNRRKQNELNLASFISRHISVPCLFMVRAFSVAGRHRWPVDVWLSTYW